MLTAGAQSEIPDDNTTPGRTDRSVIAYLAFLGVLLATGIDIALPAFDAIEQGLGGASRA